MNFGWLTVESAEPKARDLIAHVYEEIRSKDRTVTTSIAEEARVAKQSHFDRRAILLDWFESSIGLVHGEDRETWYITEAPVGAQFADMGIVRWTNWIGDVVTRVRNAILDGEFPAELSYGPPDREAIQEIGPFVEYVIRHGEIQRCDFKYGTQLGVDLEELEQELTPAEPQYGLRTRIRTLDLAQNEQIRGPVNGIYILTGGPGTGKTTVALHRIPFLIDAHADPQVPIPRDTPLVTEENTLVVVWEPHLAPYLRACLDALGLNQIPRANVALIRDWLSTELRSQIPFGPQAYRRVDNEPAHVAQVKAILTEDLLGEFLDSGPLLADSLRAELAFHVRGAQQLQDEILDAVPDLDEIEGASDLDSEITYRNIAGRIGSLLIELEKPKHKGDNATRMRQRLESLQSTVRGARIVAVLRAFYQSDEVADAVTESFGEERLDAFHQAIRQQAENRRLSDADRFLLLWLIDLPETSVLLEQRVERLPRYAHIMIDEAQYYEPIVLRLLSRLCEVPQGTMTIVGDLEQRVTPDGGLIKWESAGLSVSQENIHRLEVNYRWSEPVFEFLDTFQHASGIESPLTRPKRWFTKNGRPPQLHTFASNQDELDRVVNEIAKFRHSDDGTLWTAAVIVPDSYQGDAQRLVVEQLNDYAIAATWAEGDQVRDSVYKVVVTKYNNVVGLEFNAVFVVGIHEILKEASKEEVQAVWVALSRAHQFLFVSRVGGDPIFDRPEFDKFRQ